MRILAGALLLGMTWSAMRAQAPAASQPSSGDRIQEVPTTPEISRPLDSMNYDTPQTNPANQAPAAICDPLQLDVRVGVDNASNGHHGVPVAFTNNGAACTLGPGVDVRLENSYPGQRRVAAKGAVPAHVEATVQYRPIPLRSCQNCGDFQFGPSTGQDLVLQAGATAFVIVGYTTLNSAPCATADALSWTISPGTEPGHQKVQMTVCAPLKFSGILRQLPAGFSAP